MPPIGTYPSPAMAGQTDTDTQYADYCKHNDWLFRLCHADQILIRTSAYNPKKSQDVDRCITPAKITTVSDQFWLRRALNRLSRFLATVNSMAIDTSTTVDNQPTEEAVEVGGMDAIKEAIKASLVPPKYRNPNLRKPLRHRTACLGGDSGGPQSIG